MFQPKPVNISWFVIELEIQQCNTFESLKVIYLQLYHSVCRYT